MPIMDDVSFDESALAVLHAYRVGYDDGKLAVYAATGTLALIAAVITVLVVRRFI